MNAPLASLALLVTAAVTTASAAITDADAFAKLKTLRGTWDGPVMPGMGKLRTTFRPISGGSAVLETNFPGTKNEMVSVYHLDSRGRLVMTHYCMAGNQPQCRLDTARSSAAELIFAHAGGDNLRTTPMHMHGAKIAFASADKITTGCESYKDGKPNGEHSSTLRRIK